MTVGRRRAALVLAALATLGAACGTTVGADTDETPTPEASSVATATATPPAAPASPSVEPSPSPTPAPIPETYRATIEPIPTDLEREMRGETWRPGCPVPIGDLRLITLRYWGFDGRVHEGPLVVNRIVAEDVAWVFGRLFRARFPIKRLELTKRFRPNREEHDTRHNPSAAFNCRPVVTPFGPGDDFSQHAYGFAIDINPLQNPYVVDGYVRNGYARPYVDRSRREPGMIHAGDVVVRSFARVGWSWGGFWSSGKDYMHFSYTGR